MLSSISWQHYIAAVSILTSSYYLYVALRYYSGEIANIFSQSHSAKTFANIRPVFADVMGIAKPEDGVSLAHTSDLQFGESLPDDLENHSNETEGTVDTDNKTVSPAEQLVDEASQLIHAFQGVDDKQEFLLLLKIQISAYEQYQEDFDLRDTLKLVVGLAKNKLPFSFDLQDLQPSGA